MTSSPETLKHKFQDARDSLKIYDYYSYLKKPEKEKHLIVGWERICQGCFFFFFLRHEPSWNVFAVSHPRTPDPGPKRMQEHKGLEFA